MINYSVILLLAGASKRANLTINKVYYEIDNKPLFIYSLEKFLQVEGLDKIVIVFNELDYDLLQKYLLEYNDKIIICKGGETRQESVLNGLEMVKSKYVLIHDGARPLITIGLINDVLHNLERFDCVVPAVKVKETIKSLEGCVKTVPRDNIYLAQTPQGVNRLLLKDCLLKARNENVLVTDDSYAIERYSNTTIKVIDGKTTNIKVTLSDDIQIVKKLLEV